MTDNNNTVNINSAQEVQPPQQDSTQCSWYKSDDKFLHFFECKEKAKSFIGLELKTGVRILTILSLFFGLLTIFDQSSIFGFLMQAIGLYADSTILYSTWSKNYNHALIGYVIAVVFFWIEMLFIIMISLFIAFYFANLKVLMIFFLLIFILYTIKVYCIWIVFSYMHTLKHSNEQGNLGVVQNA